MPIKHQTKEALVQKIKQENDPKLQIQLIALYKLLMQVYEEDDHFDKVSQKGNYEYHHKIRNLFFKGIAIMKGEEPVSMSSLKNPERFFSKEELEKQ